MLFKKTGFLDLLIFTNPARSSVAKPWRIKGFSLLMVNVGSSWVQLDMVCAACSYAACCFLNTSQVWSACLAGGGSAGPLWGRYKNSNF